MSGIFITVLTLIVSSFCLPGFAQSTKASEKSQQGINFIENDWDLALKNAKENNKLVFLDIYATWCGPCKLLKQYTFSDAKTGDFFNKNFVNVSIDGEKGIGPALARQYSIEGYPTMVVTDSTGKPVLITAGYIPTDVLMQFANEALKRDGRKPAM
ncbi:MAG: thioredoxin family protein [Bacteroidetes bacterium]|nr:thioredoxin family protein [Bacteroidota bacterium]